MIRAAAALIVVCVAVGALFVYVDGQSLTFTQLTNDPGWSQRHDAALRFSHNAFTYPISAQNSLTAPKGSFVFFSGRRVADSAAGSNDVWVSLDGAKYEIVAGVDTYSTKTPQPRAFAPYDTTSWTPATLFSAEIQNDANDQLFLIGGCTSYTAGPYNQNVFTSKNFGLSWETVVSTGLPVRCGSVGVITDDNTIIIVGGWGSTAGNSLNDVYSSTNGGATWSVVSSSAPWPQRGGHNVELVHSGSMNQNHMILLAGHGLLNGVTTAYFNDVWASSDYGATWSLIAPAAPFSRREGAAMEVTQSGMMILASGYGQQSATGENDIWISLTGGRSWGQVEKDAKYQDRWWTSIELDSDEKLLIAGGYISATANSNDVWRSDQSFSNIAPIATQAGVTMPPCGIGLQCWPKTPDDWCTPACVSQGRSDSGNGVAIAFAVIFTIGFAVAAYLLYIERGIRYGTIDQSMCAPAAVVDLYAGNARGSARAGSDVGTTGGEAYSALGR